MSTIQKCSSFNADAVSVIERSWQRLTCDSRAAFLNCDLQQVDRRINHLVTIYRDYSADPSIRRALSSIVFNPLPAISCSIQVVQSPSPWKHFLQSARQFRYVPASHCRVGGDGFRRPRIRLKLDVVFPPGRLGREISLSGN
jgi:hypothetical protein